VIVRCPMLSDAADRQEIGPPQRQQPSYLRSRKRLQQQRTRRRENELSARPQSHRPAARAVRRVATVQPSRIRPEVAACVARRLERTPDCTKPRERKEARCNPVALRLVRQGRGKTATDEMFATSNARTRSSSSQTPASYPPVSKWRSSHSSSTQAAETFNGLSEPRARFNSGSRALRRLTPAGRPFLGGAQLRVARNACQCLGSGTFSPRRICDTKRSERPVARASRLSGTFWIIGRISRSKTERSTSLPYRCSHSRSSAFRLAVAVLRFTAAGPP
jgi:hypothetical protein